AADPSAPSTTSLFSRYGFPRLIAHGPSSGRGLEGASRRSGRRWPLPRPRQSQAQDALPDRTRLPSQRSGCVRQAEPLAQGADPRRDLRVPVAGQVGEQMMLDLVAEVTAHDVEEAAAVDIARAEQLAQ